MGRIVVLAEKPDIGTRLAATLGGCYINGTELKPELLANKKWEGLIKKERHAKGFLLCNYKGREITVTWGFGHLAELKQAKDYNPKYARWSEGLFPFIPPSFELKVKEDQGIKKHFQLIKRLLNDKDTDYIINATDADREGEVIFDYIYRVAECNKPYKRLWISSFTEEAIINGFKGLKSSTEVMPLTNAGRCRGIADWLVGSNLTAMATLKFGGFKNMVSIGRVQTPTLAMLVKRELDIRGFKPETYYELLGTFQTQAGAQYRGKWKKGKIDRFVEQEKAQQILDKIQGQNGVIIKNDQTVSKELPPLLFDLTALQGEANSRFGFSAKKTLDLAQKLYENQFLTYPRTNSRYLTADLKPEIARIFRSLPGDYATVRDKLMEQPLNYSKRVFDNSKVESHTAIIPTYKTPKGLGVDEQKVYDLVARSLLQAFMPPAVWANTKLETEVVGEIFASSGKVLLEPGWRELTAKAVSPKRQKEKDEDESQQLPKVQMGENVLGKEYAILKKETKAPKRFNEKTLLSAMETAGKQIEDEELKEAMKDHGLGTPATRAATIERLIQVEYLAREGKNLVPTEKGMYIIEALPVEELKSPQLTGEWEYKLNQVEKDKLEPEGFISEIINFTRETTQKLKQQPKQLVIASENHLGPCPKCGASVVPNKKGYGCSSWREGCKFQIWSPVAGRDLSEETVRHLLEKGITPQLKGFQSKAGKSFAAALEFVKDGNGKVNFKF
jgi:DNA topoisomerase III